MFAYCNNNPVKYVDTAGTLPVPCLPIWEYYFIHRRVQEHIVLTHGFAMEVRVQLDDFHTGRLDLYDGESNQYYEVKNIGAAYGPATANQMFGYDNAVINDWRFIFSRNGETPDRGTSTSIRGSFSYKIYTVSYEHKGNGLIVYAVEYSPDAIAAIAMVATVGLLSSGVRFVGDTIEGELNPAFSTY